MVACFVYSIVDASVAEGMEKTRDNISHMITKNSFHLTTEFDVVNSLSLTPVICSEDGNISNRID